MSSTDYISMFKSLFSRNKKYGPENALFLQSILDNIPGMIFIKEASDLRFKLFNKATEDLLGYKSEELIGKTDHDFFPKDQADFFNEKDRDVLKAGRIVDIPEEPIKTKAKGLR